MKKLIISLLGGIIYIGFSFGENITMNTPLQSPQTSCQVQESIVFYQNGPMKYFHDVLGGTTNTNYRIITSKSYIQIYNPYNALSFILPDGGFAYKSLIKPAGYSEIMVIQQNNSQGTSIINHSNSRNSLAAQIVYHIGRMKEIKQGGDGIVTLSQNLQYMLPNGTVGNTGKGLHFPSINNQSLVPTYFTEDNECYNIYVARCGDGIVDNGTETSSSNINASLKGNEQCDLGAQNGQPGSTCSSTCQTVTLQQPTCNSTYNGQTFDVLSSSNNLCTSPATISDFISTPTGRTWKCNGQAGTAPAQCSATKTITPQQPNLRINKTFIDGTKGNKVYHTYDLVGYKITFGNNGSGTATGVILKDLLPQNLKLESSQFVYTPTISYTHTGYSSGTIRIEEYTDMTLPPHSSGYLILTGKVLDTHTDSTLNKACIFHTTKTECSQVLYTTTQPSLKIEKRVDNSEVKVGDIVTFTLTITNTSKLPISGFTITDTLPANNVISYINQSSDGFTFSKTNNQLIWGNYTKTLQPNSSISVDFKAKVETTGIHTNFACITHIDFPQWGAQPFSSLNCDKADVQAREQQYCTTPSVSPTTIWANTLGDGSTSVTCATSNRENAGIIEIDCGNGAIHTAHSTNSLSQRCSYSLGNNANSRNYTITCRVDGKSSDKNGRNCTNTITIERDGRQDIGYCGDGVAEMWEDCDCYDRSKNCNLNNANIASRANGNYNNAMCKNCKIVDDKDIGLVKPIACFNVNNGSLSINKGELLPFYRNIEKIGSDKYVEAERYQYSEALDAYKNLPGNSCGSDGDIALNAMVCVFKVYNGKEMQSKGDSIYEIEVPCFTKGTDIQYDWEKSNLIKSFLNNNKFTSYSINNTRGYAFRSSVFVIDNFGNTSARDWRDWFTTQNGRKLVKAQPIDTFGEYKLSLDEVQYLQCVDGQRIQQKPYPRICEVDFSVTKPYTIQKTPSGTIKKTTTDLDKFYMYADGTRVNYTSFLNNILAVNDKEYNNTPQIINAMNAFISKYSKLAVKVNSTTLGTVANGVSVKKVPGKNIYFVDGNLKIEGTNTVYNKPFTIIQTIGDTTIKGNLHHNMMLLTNGKITFDGSASCTATQTLKGIYYAKGGFYSINVSFNNNLNNPSRCTKGNLHIKGIAIGDGLINNVMANRRSELNQWFTCKSPTTQCQTQRRNYIMNGAALLIEYSPSIFTTATMPPGAEEFTKALEVYKT